MWRKRKPFAAATATFFLLLQFHPPPLYAADMAEIEDPCDPRSLPDPLTLRSDQLTVLISGYSVRRLPLLRSLAAAYSAHPAVAAVVVLWGDASTPAALLSASIPPTIAAVVRTAASLNERFVPRAVVRTRAVAVCDDDIEIDGDSLSLAFEVSRSRAGGGLVGFFARAHELDLQSRRWIYTSRSRDRYSIVLTKFVIVPTSYLSLYTCGGGEAMAAARRVVDGARNCEDILMNFLAASETRLGPVVVEGRRRVRDYGDPRNSKLGNSSSDIDGGDEDGIRRAGLSGRGDHWKRRGECIVEFHRIFGRMPLRYTYGKVVGLAEAGDHSLCRKGQSLVPCDQQHTEQIPD